jgi:hypothetical protein
MIKVLRDVLLFQLVNGDFRLGILLISSGYNSRIMAMYLKKIAKFACIMKASLYIPRPRKMFHLPPYNKISDSKSLNTCFSDFLNLRSYISVNI